MTRFLPRSLFGQTLLILLAGLIVSHAIGSWIYTADREQAVRAVGGFATAQRIANLTRLVQDTPAESRQRIVAALNDQTFRVALSAQPPPITIADGDAIVAEAIAAFLVERLSLGSGRKPRVLASSADGPPFGPWQMMGHGPMMHGFGGFAGFRDSASRNSPGGWPVALVCDCPAGRRSRVLLSVPPLHGRDGNHHSRRVRVGRPARDRTARLARDCCRAARPRCERVAPARSRHHRDPAGRARLQRHAGAVAQS